jgi:hypothetical protein
VSRGAYLLLFGVPVPVMSWISEILSTFFWAAVAERKGGELPQTPRADAEIPGEHPQAKTPEAA